MKTWRPGWWQRLKWAAELAWATWRGSCEVALGSDDDHPDDVAARIRAAEKRAMEPHRRIEN